MKAKLQKPIWWLIGLSSVLIGLYPFAYFLVDRHFGLLSTKSAELLSDGPWNVAFYIHIVCGGLALLVGWLQFSKKLRVKRIKLHRRIGKFYVVMVALSGLCGVYIGLFATGGLISMIGFEFLAIIWLSTTILAFLSIRNGNLIQHQKLMIFSYAACFGAVTLRIWLPILTAWTGDFYTAYPIVAWLAWVPNMVVAYFLARRINIPSAKSHIETR